MNTRRDFLQKIGASALMLQLSSLTASANAPGQVTKPYEGKILRVAIMGLGGYGTRVAEAMKACNKSKAGWYN